MMVNCIFVQTDYNDKCLWWSGPTYFFHSIFCLNFYTCLAIINWKGLRLSMISALKMD